MRVGAQFPLTNTRESEATLFLQIGNHASWGSLIGPKPERRETYG